MKEVDPGWVCGCVPTRAAFSQADKDAQVRWCQEYKWLKPSYWYQVVWVDEFTVYEKPELQTLIHRKGNHLTATDFKLHPFGCGTYGKLSVCIAVNAYVGLVGF